MMLALVYSRAQRGVDAPLVSVETHITNGLPAFNIVGLPEASVRESKERVRSAIINSGYEFPTRRITVNLAPADIPKEGTRFDLSIAIGVLAASSQIPCDALGDIEWLAELSLGGEIRGVAGILPAALACGRDQRTLFVGEESATEATLCEQTTVIAPTNLREVCLHLEGSASLSRVPFTPRAMADFNQAPDLADVRGQYFAKRALEIAAAGGHNLLFVGPPGTGKTMLAVRLPGIMPPLTENEAFESAAIYSVSRHTLDASKWRLRPFRSPHHTSSAAAIIGGGSNPSPGEVSLAHHGILFLDELPEFDRRVLEVLREPLETGKVTISRAARQAEFPASIQLIAAMNPCPCGYDGDLSGRCRCAPTQIQRYHSRISGPLLDRIDMHIHVPRQPDWHRQNKVADDETSATVRSRVIASRERQIARQDKLNAHLDPATLERLVQPTPDSLERLQYAIERFCLSARAYHRILKIARTIADLDSREKVNETDIGEALNLRCLDRMASLTS